jgi:hypothetical protein
MYPGLTPVYQLPGQPAEIYTSPVFIPNEMASGQIKIWNRDHTGRESRVSEISTI